MFRILENFPFPVYFDPLFVRHLRVTCYLRLLFQSTVDDVEDKIQIDLSKNDVDSRPVDYVEMKDPLHEVSTVVLQGSKDMDTAMVQKNSKLNFYRES